MAETGQLRLASQNRVTKYPSARTPPTVSPPSEGACHGPADVQLIRAVSSLGSSGWRALEPVWPGDPLSVWRALARSGDVVWHDPKSVARDIASIIGVFLHPFASLHNFDSVTAFLPEEHD